MDRWGPREWARLRILQACERLEIPSKLWPNIPFPALPRPYQYEYRLSDAPAFNPLYESESEWRSRLDAFVDSQLAEFRKKLRADLDSGFLKPIKQTRTTTPLELRYEWAAKRLCLRTPYRDLADETVGQEKVCDEDVIKKAVASILKEACLGKGK